MKPRLSNPVLADRGCRLAGVGFTDRLVPRSAFPTAQASQADTHCAEPAAPSGSSLGGAAFSSFALRASEDGSHFTETCPTALPGQARAAPDVTTPASGAVAPLTRASHAIHLPEHVMVLVRAIAAYERCSNERATVLALADYAQKIGAGPLARAVFDLGDDLADVPDFERRAENRFKSGE